MNIINEKIIYFKYGMASLIHHQILTSLLIELNQPRGNRSGWQVTDRKSDDELFYLFLFSFTRKPHSFIRPDHPHTIYSRRSKPVPSFPDHIWRISIILSSRWFEIPSFFLTCKLLSVIIIWNNLKMWSHLNFIYLIYILT